MNEETEDEIAKILEHIETYPEKTFVLSEKEKLLLFNYIIDLHYEFEKTKQQRDHFRETLNLHYDNFKKYKKENERLNNIINGMEKFFKY